MALICACLVSGWKHLLVADRALPLLLIPSGT
jgi:hypothetical protein